MEVDQRFYFAKIVHKHSIYHLNGIPSDLCTKSNVNKLSRIITPLNFVVCIYLKLNLMYFIYLKLKT